MFNRISIRAGPLFREVVWLATEKGNHEVVVEGDLKEARLTFKDGKTVNGRIELIPTRSDGGREARVTAFVATNREIDPVYLFEDYLSSQKNTVKTIPGSTNISIK